MKKVLSIVLTLVMVFAMHSAVSAAEENTLDDINEWVSSVYGIPLSVLETMPEDMFLSLVENIDTESAVSTNETYWKVAFDENGESIACEATYQEYLASKLLRDTDECSWMRIHTTIVDNGSTAQISAAYTWLTHAAPRMTDVIGLAITHGTLIDNSADGFYTYTTSDGNVYVDLGNTPSGFVYQGQGLVRKVNLAKPNNTVTAEMLFMKANIYKNTSSEGLYGSYAHQLLSLSYTPSFTIDGNGIICNGSVSLGTNYRQFSGYTSIAW